MPPAVLGGVRHIVVLLFAYLQCLPSAMHIVCSFLVHPPAVSLAVHLLEVILRHTALQLPASGTLGLGVCDQVLPSGYDLLKWVRWGEGALKERSRAVLPCGGPAGVSEQQPGLGISSQNPDKEGSCW